MMKKVRALGLSSGGLDSILAALVLRRQGIEVSWVAFETPFFDAENARKAALAHGIPFRVEDITGVYLPMLKAPAAGYGKAMNPCKDCHALMFHEAGRIMEAEGFDFLFSGEVSGQRPMSQTRSALRYVEKRAGYEGRILRPLSARNLPPTQVEEEGRVDRSQLLDFQGRGRKPQLALARELGVRDFPAPAGGCLLTDVTFGKRLKDLMTHDPEAKPTDYHLLKNGRHFRLSPEVKLVVGRTQADNAALAVHFDARLHTRIQTLNFPGPLAFLCGPAGQQERRLAAGLVAGYTRAADSVSVTLVLDGCGGEEKVDVLPVRSPEIREKMV